ncbi:zinc-dependent metalloprotease [Yinghuangia soli]|uniref:Zinc-dependent metalloprotease n=1 Tax=Yinghuangia soli TaxID=2908204 RepID=A0AA41Q370_9ACTN|nr:zinc-dependent metalloprotease [Yinghuangia soli]MCF2529896.1 zinc-dependent metalloprotease [Yinghuangia soli]
MGDFPFGFGKPSGGNDPDRDPDSSDASGGSGSSPGFGFGDSSGGSSGGGKGPGGPLGPGGPGGFDPFGGDPDNPFGALFGNMNPADLGAAFQQLGKLLSYEGGPVNWDLAHDIARQTVAQKGGDASIGQVDRSAVEEAVRLAELWLDEATPLPSGASTTLAWSRAEWIEATLPQWKDLVEPLATRVVSAMGEMMPGEMQQMAGPLIGMMRGMGGAMFGAQVGQALGALAGEVVGSADIGLPIGPAGRAALLPANLAAFGAGLGLPQDEVRLYLALREAAHQRLFAHVPWLRQHLFGAVDAYARGIKVDMSRLEEAAGRLDPTNPEALQEAFTQGLFEPEETPQQKAALARLETALALVEGWVDAVVHAAAAPRLPSADALRETLRRRRATGGPAEQTFATLVGLELRPRRLRDASRLWASLADARGIEGRDALWAHPDMLPTADDLDDPDGFVHREELDLSGLTAQLDADLEALDAKAAQAAQAEKDKNDSKDDTSEDGQGKADEDDKGTPA